MTLPFIASPEARAQSSLSKGRATPVAPPTSSLASSGVGGAFSEVQK